MLSGPSCVCAGNFWASQRKEGADKNPLEGRKNPACLLKFFPALLRQGRGASFDGVRSSHACLCAGRFRASKKKQEGRAEKKKKKKKKKTLHVCYDFFPNCSVLLEPFPDHSRAEKNPACLRKFFFPNCSVVLEPFPHRVGGHVLEDAFGPACVRAGNLKVSRAKGLLTHCQGWVQGRSG